MKKFLISILLILSLLCLSGCGANRFAINGAWVDIQEYQHNNHNYLIFTNGSGGIFVIEEND